MIKKSQLYCYCLSPVRRMPRMNCRWKMIYIRITGRDDNKVAAMIKGHCDMNWVLSKAKPSGKVRICGVSITIKGQRKLFQDSRKVKIARAANAGLLDGIMIWVYMRNSPAPSMRAASINSVGIDIINWRIRKIPNAPTIPGTIKPKKLLFQPNSTRIENAGIMVTWKGIMIVARTIINNILLPGNWNFAKT